MNRIIIKLITMIIITGVAICPMESRAAGGGCMTCHPQLSETISKAKSAEGGGANYSAKVHRSHYAKLGAAANCNLCHQIDAKGNLQVIGSEMSNEVKTTSDKLAKMQPYYKSWATSTFLDKRHGQRDVTCLKCHGTAMPAATVPKEQCFTCHGTYEKLAEKSPFHNSTLYPHFTPDALECNLCHKGHQKSTVFCTQCHKVEAKMP